MFDPRFHRVALIRKAKPEWQKGKLNGIGGKIEEGEGPFAAMVREFREETGVDHRDWGTFAEMTGPDWSVVALPPPVT